MNPVGTLSRSNGKKTKHLTYSNKQKKTRSSQSKNKQWSRIYQTREESNDDGPSSRGNTYSPQAEEEVSKIRHRGFGTFERVFHRETIQTFHITRSQTSSLAANEMSTVFFLVLGPKKRQFEMVEISFCTSVTKVGDLLDMIPGSCKNEPLRKQTYRGLCRPTNGIEIINRSLKVVGPNTGKSCKIMTGEVLVAIPNRLSGRECMKLAQNILRNKFATSLAHSSIDLTKSTSAKLFRRFSKCRVCETVEEERDEDTVLEEDTESFQTLNSRNDENEPNNISEKRNTYSLAKRLFRRLTFSHSRSPGLDPFVHLI